MFAPEESKVINLLPPKDISAAAHSVAYVSLKNYNHVDFIVTLGATSAVGSSKNVSVKEAKDTSGTSAQSLNIPYYWKNSAALSSASTANDTYVKQSIASSSTNAFALSASTNNITYIIPIDASQLSQASSMDCVGIGIDTTSSTALCGAVAVLSKSRYRSDNPPSAL